MRKMGVSRAYLAITLATCCIALAAWSQNADPRAVRELLGSIEGPNTVDAPRQTTTSGGFLTYLGAPQGNAFETGAAAKSAATVDAAARSFVMDHAGAFAVPNDKLNFGTRRISASDGRTYVHLEQTYDGLTVFGSGMVVQLNADGNVECVFSDILRHSSQLYSGSLNLVPSIAPAEAKAAAIAFLQSEHPDATFYATEPALEIYEPSVIGAVGTTKLVWNLVVDSDYASGGGEPIKEKVLVDAHGGGVALHYSLIHHARNRKIYDSENTTADPGTLKRSEGEAATGITDVDTAYDYYGDTYDFYFNEHGRDSIDNLGYILSATVRYCPSPSPLFCPFANAFWDGSRMYFGEGFVADDVVAHELTHGVTQYESDLIYAYEPGAINESFSDIWGEFVDLTNGAGTDTAGVRWLLGEDIPVFGAIRDMKHPPNFVNNLGDAILPMPDRYLGVGWYFGANDNGGVHHNSGVGNKLCFLLTDGQTFNGFDIIGMGISKVADLFYECQTNLLTPASDYPALGDMLLQAASNLSYSQDETDTIRAALYATEIITEEGPFLRHFRATGMSGSASVALTWQNPEGFTPFTGVDIVRRTDRFPDPEVPNDGTPVVSLTGGEESYVDGPHAAGTILYYCLYPRAGSFGSNLPLIARVVVGQDVDYSSEAFSDGVDLVGHQVTFVPAVNYSDAAASGFPEYYVNHSNYTPAVSDGSGAKVAPDFDGTLPVPKEDIIPIPLADESYIAFAPDVPFPFFGEFYNTLYLSANGFISPVAPGTYADPMDATPTLENHFGKRRISFLFSDLDPGSGGLVWARFLNDRIVVTFEDVPAFADVAVPGASVPNTVQVELFYSGTIRCTYLGLNAKRAVVGLSDGNGVPLDPADVIGNNLPASVLQTDFTSLSGPIDLELLPIPIVFATVGSTVEFTAEAISNIGLPTYSLEGAPAGATIDPNTGEFTWDSSGFGENIYSFIVCATAGGVDACQLVNVWLSASSVKPVANNVTLTPAEPRDAEPLMLSYSYSHPTLPEGPTAIIWFKNGAVIPAFNNVTMVPPGATKVGETWHCVVMPTTVRAGFDYYGTPVYLRGTPVQTEHVTILPDLKTDANKDGKVNSADLQVVVGKILGMQPEAIDGDVNSDGSTDVSDVQVIVNTILIGGE